THLLSILYFHHSAPISDLHSFPTRRSSDLFTHTATTPPAAGWPPGWPANIQRTAPSSRTPQRRSPRLKVTPAPANSPAKSTAPRPARQSRAISQSLPLLH